MSEHGVLNRAAFGGTGPRPRRVFGRRTADVAGVEYRFEMGPDGVAVRAKHGRERVLLGFESLVGVAFKRDDPQVEFRFEDGSDGA